MRNYLQYGLAAAILFAVSASVSLWLHNRNKDDVSDEADAKDASRFLSKSDKPNAVEVGQFPPSLRDREKIVREKEEAMNQRQQKLELVQKDIHDEHARVEELRLQLQKELGDAGKKIAALNPQPPAPETPRIVSREDVAIIGRQTAPSVPVGKLFDESTPSEKIAQILLSVATDEKQFDAAIKPLAQMEKSKVQAVLAEISIPDLALSLRLTDRLLGSVPSPAVAVPPTIPTTPPMPPSPPPVAPVPPAPPLSPMM